VKFEGEAYVLMESQSSPAAPEARLGPPAGGKPCRGRREHDFVGGNESFACSVGILKLKMRWIQSWAVQYAERTSQNRRDRSMLPQEIIPQREKEARLRRASAEKRSPFVAAAFHDGPPERGQVGLPPWAGCFVSFAAHTMDDGPSGWGSRYALNCGPGAQLEWKSMAARRGKVWSTSY